MRFAMAAVTLSILGLAACGTGDKSGAANRNDLGTGINTVDRHYAKSAADTWNAAESAVKAYDLTVDNDRHDSMGGELQGHRANGEKVTIRVRSLDDKNSDVSVRVDPGNRNMAEMLHEKIADKLGLKEAKSAWFGGNTAEGTYPHSLDTCIKAADDAVKRLNLTPSNREQKDGSAVVDARDSNSNPVQFKLKKVNEGTTNVVFIAGKEKSDANRDLANRMKAEFESCCAAKSN